MANLRPDGFVELDRTFLDFREDADAEGAAFDSYFAAFSVRGSTWKDLLASQCVVVLAEAGSGKTWELRAQAAALREASRVSFFVRLEQLARSSLEDCMASEDKRSLAIWRDSSDESVFFLDAVEEAKLTTRHAFEAALRSLVEGIGANGLKRVRTVVTSRISGWRGREDRSLLRHLLDLPEEQRGEGNVNENFEGGEDASPVWALRIVTMNVLSAEQVKMLAQDVDPDRADDFLSALSIHHAWHFTRRPQDVSRLMAYWQRAGTLGDPTDLLEFDIQSRLQEFDEDRQRDSDLNDQQLRNGAEAIAAAVVLGKTFSISIENEPPGGERTAYVTPSSELPDWTFDQRRDLLTRALFDPAALGLIRFHHRSVAEYLAAYWLGRLYDRGLSVEDAYDLFFVRSHGEDVLIPSRAPVACWLACGDNVWNRRIRRNLLEISPDALLAHGDISRLDVTMRTELLKAIVAKVGAEGYVLDEVKNEQLMRLADPGISSIITELLCDAETPEDGLFILLRLVREGESALGDCVPAALSLAVSPQSSIHVLTYATAAIASAGKPLEKVGLVADLLRRPEIDERVARQAVSKMYPEYMSADALVRLAEKTRSSDHMMFPDFTDAATRVIVEDAPEDHVDPLLDGFVGLLNRRPGVTAADAGISHLVSKDNIWLAPLLRAIISRAFALPTIGDELAGKIVDALGLIELAEQFERPYESRKIDLQELSFAHPAIRRLYFWRRIEEKLLRKPGTKIGIHSIFRNDTPFEWSEHDLYWMLNDLSNTQLEEHRATALNLVIGLWWYSGTPSDFRGKVYSHICDNRRLRRLYRKEFPNAATVAINRHFPDNPQVHGDHS